jgi:deazaflavin-dependent oxidoreductase (nitroreductase family)
VLPAELDPSAWYPAKGKPGGDLLGGKFGHAIDRVCVLICNRSILAWLYAPRPRGQKPIPTVLFRTIGRHTGQLRTKIIPAFPDEGRFILAATNHGKARDPQWVENLRANSSSWIYWRWKWHSVTAVTAADAERAELFDRIVKFHAPLLYFDEIGRRNGRAIPLVIATKRHKE